MPFNPRYLWIAVGFLGQALFFGRFFDKAGLSHGDRVFVGISKTSNPTTGFFIYSRNLWFIHRPQTPQIPETPKTVVAPPLEPPAL